MTAIKIGERYRRLRSLEADREGVVFSEGEAYDWHLRDDDGESFFADSDSLFPVNPPVPPFSNGDIIRLESPDAETTVVGRVHDDVWVGSDIGTRFTITSRTDQGWSLSVVEWAPRELPTREGFYVSPDGQVFTLADGRWQFGTKMTVPALVRQVGPLTRLVPEVSAS